MKRAAMCCLLACFALAGFVLAKNETAAGNVLSHDEFVQNWQIAGPVNAPFAAAQPTMDDQRRWFEKLQIDPNAVVASLASGQYQAGETTLKWQAATAEANVIDLVKILGQHDYAYAFAYAEITSATAAPVLFGLGSDDAVRVWVNGEKVFDNFIGRAVAADNDLVETTLTAGKNTVLLLVYNMQSGWGLTLRPLGDKMFPEMLISSAAQGNIDQMAVLTKYNADPNTTVGPGLTPLHAATLRGRSNAVAWLKEHGAKETPMPANEAYVDFLFNRAVKENYPGAAVLVARDGKVVYKNGFGLENIDKKTKITPETKFRIGSVTKQFTACAILKLQEQGKLSVQDKLTKFFPDFPRGDEVTIHHLLTHTSGIHSFTETLDFLDNVTKPVTREDMLKKIASLGYDFDPGVSWSYNNSGFYLLGLIIEKASGKTYAEALSDFFFTPLGMKNSGVHTPGIELEHEALGYMYEGEVKSALDWNMDVAGGAGNIYSTVLDLYIWNEAIFNGKVLKPESQKAAFTPVVLNNGQVAAALGGGYGYGWALTKNRGLDVIEHGGGLHGFNTTLLRIPAHNFSVAIVSNALPNIPNLNPAGLGAQIAELYLHEFMTVQEAPQMATEFDPAKLDDYVGKYDYQSAIMTIQRRGDRLFAQLTGQQEFEIFPSSPDKFFWKVVDAQIEFQRDGNGLVTHAIHKQNGTELNVVKMKDKQIVAVSADVLQKYSGEYELMPGTIIIVTQEAEKLFVQLTGQPKLQVFPSAETVFFLKEVNAQLTFQKAADGKVNGVELLQGAFQKVAPKIK